MFSVFLFVCLKMEIYLSKFWRLKFKIKVWAGLVSSESPSWPGYTFTWSPSAQQPVLVFFFFNTLLFLKSFTDIKNLQEYSRVFSIPQI